MKKQNMISSMYLLLLFIIQGRVFTTCIRKKSNKNACNKEDI